MTSQTVTYESVSSRGHVGPGIRTQATWGLDLTSLNWRVVDGESNPIQDPLIPFSGFVIPPIQSVFFRTITDDAAIRSFGFSWQGQDTVQVDGVTLDNADVFITTQNGLGSGRVAPDVILNAGGAVATALAALTGTTTQLDVNASCGYDSETYMGLQHFCEFQENPPDSTASGAVRLRELQELFEISSSRYQIGIDAAAQPFFVEQCGFAALDPGGVVYIRPEDIGPGALMIPMDIGMNTAAAFRAHPSVFYPSGKSQYVRAITRQFVDTIAISTTGAVQPIKIISVTADPIDSLWLVTIDGAAMVIRVTHPSASDLRRPRDIWEQAILPLINAGGANQAAQVYRGVFNDVGDANLSRLEYADYWRCLGIAGTRIIQTGGPS